MRYISTIINNKWPILQTLYILRFRLVEKKTITRLANFRVTIELFLVAPLLVGGKAEISFKMVTTKFQKISENGIDFRNLISRIVAAYVYNQMKQLGKRKIRNNNFVVTQKLFYALQLVCNLLAASLLFHNQIVTLIVTQCYKIN